MEEYTPNSHKFKAEIAEKKKVEKVVKGKVGTRKKSGVRKLTDIFVSEDAANVKSYILMDVLIPSVKKAISDIVTNGIDMILYGGSGQTKKLSLSSKISYRNFYERDDERYRESRKAKNGYSYDEIVLETRGEAEEVLTRMDELIETYGMVSVADLYDLVGITCNYTDNKYGWTSVRNAEPVRTRDGYVLKLSRPIPIN